MKTDELVAMLAAGATPVHRRAAARRCAIAIALGLVGAFAVMTAFLGVGSDIADRAMLPMFWVKLIFVAWLAAAGALALTRVSRPGVPLGWVPAGLAVPVLLVWLLAAVVLSSADGGHRTDLIFGHTWSHCPLLIALHAVPAFVAAIWTLQGLAPTNLRLAGAVAGLVAGAVGAVAYSVHCPELAAPFLGIWYLLGILIPTALGAALGPKLLRW